MIYLPLILTLLFIGPALAAIANRRSLSMGGHLLLFGLCIFYGIFPLLIAWGGLSLSDRFGCEAEAIIFNCPAPSWHGDLVTGMVFAHWLAIVTIPSAILGAVAYILKVFLIGILFFIIGSFGIGFITDKWLDGHLRRLEPSKAKQ